MLAASAQPPELLAPIEFHFDFASPYGYIASELIDALGARYGRPVVWRVMLLGAAFKASGNIAPVQQPLKGDYFRQDILRSARFHDVPLRLPPAFPFSSLHAARAFNWLAQQDALRARSLAHALLRAAFTAARPIDQLDTVLDIAASQGVDRAQLAEALGSVSVKEQLHREVERSLSRGVFGSPFFIVDGEPFWGLDRLPQLERWLREGDF